LRRAVWAAVGALAIAGCGGSSSPDGTGEATTADKGNPPGPSRRGGRQEAARNNENAFRARRNSRLRALSPCPDSKLLVWNGPGRSGVGLGHVYVQLTVANLSGRACKVSGVPEVTAIDLEAERIGPPARAQPRLNPAAKRDAPATVILARTDSARFELSWVTPYGFSPSACHIRMGAGFRVKLPGAGSAQRVPYPVVGCSQGVPGLAVGRIE
jgi:Protein of unknown function (DUF4232)